MSSQRAASDREAGFSLFECIVALAVFSLAAISGVSLITQNVYSAGQIELRTFAGFVAENVLVETRIDENLVLGASAGETEMGGFVFQWARDITETGEGELRQVVVRVRRKNEPQVLSTRYGFRKG